MVDVLADCGVKTIALRNAGFDRVDVEAAKARGMRIFRVPTYSPNSVAEHAVAILLAVNRLVVVGELQVSGRQTTSSECRTSLGRVDTATTGHCEGHRSLGRY